MSEREPITAELRELMGGVEPRVDEDGVVTAKYVTPEAWGEFVRRCDAIDAVHAGLERENAELHQRVAELDESVESMHETDAWKLGYDEGFASADDWMADNEDAMAEHGWVKLPVDADGEVVRIGDVMVMASHPFGCEDKPLVVDRMELSRGMHGEVWCLALDTDRSCWTQVAVLRHYHAPTVEDVLQKLLEQAVGYSDAHTTVALNAIAEYAKRLTLAGDAE